MEAIAYPLGLHDLIFIIMHFILKELLLIVCSHILIEHSALNVTSVKSLMCTCCCLGFSFVCALEWMFTSHMPHICRTAGITRLVFSTDVPDQTPSHHCSEQGHMEGATFWEWKAFLVPGSHISKVTVLSLKCIHRQADPLSATPLTVDTVLFSPVSGQESSLFIASRMQSHSHSAERLLLFKAHNNRTKTLKWGSLELCSQSFTEYKTASLLVVYSCDNDIALSYILKEALLIIRK